MSGNAKEEAEGAAAAAAAAIIDDSALFKQDEGEHFQDAHEVHPPASSTTTTSSSSHQKGKDEDNDGVVKNDDDEKEEHAASKSEAVKAGVEGTTATAGQGGQPPPQENREIDSEDKYQKLRELREQEHDIHKTEMQHLEEQIAALRDSKDDDTEAGVGGGKETEEGPTKRNASDLSATPSSGDDGDNADADGPPKKRRGRPPGSKNRESRKLPFSSTPASSLTPEGGGGGSGEGEGENGAGGAGITGAVANASGGEPDTNKPKSRGRPRKNPGTEPSVYVLANERGQLNAKNWLKHYEMVKEFKRQHGHCNVPVGTHHIDPATGAIDEVKNKFRRWIMMMRTDHRYLREGRHTSLTQEKIQLLSSIGFEWRLLERKYSWQGQFDRLVQWKEEYGNVNVPQKATKKKCYEGLGDWVLKIRRAYREGRLPQEQIDQLNGVEFKWTLRKKGGTIEQRIAATRIKRAIENTDKKSSKKGRKSKSLSVVTAATVAATVAGTTATGDLVMDNIKNDDSSKIIVNNNTALENAAAVAASSNSAALDAAMAAAAAAAVSGITTAANGDNKDALLVSNDGGVHDDTNKDSDTTIIASASIPQELPPAQAAADEELEQAQLSPVHIGHVEEC